MHTFDISPRGHLRASGKKGPSPPHILLTACPENPSRWIQSTIKLASSADGHLGEGCQEMFVFRLSDIASGDG